MLKTVLLSRAREEGITRAPAPSASPASPYRRLHAVRIGRDVDLIRPLPDWRREWTTP